MSISTHFCDPQQWAQTHFGGTTLGNTRRSRWVVKLVVGWARQPGARIPQLGAGQAGASKAAYCLLSSMAATPEALQAPHQALVRQAVLAAGTWLLVEDTTELSWPETDERRPGLGPVGPAPGHEPGRAVALTGGCRLARPGPQPGRQTPPLPLLGLLGQQLHVRQPVPATEKGYPHDGSRLRQGCVRESALWSQSLRHVGSPVPGTRWVVVADCGADIYEHLQQCQAQGLGFVVRAAQDQALVCGIGKVPAGWLFAVARAQASAGQFTLVLRGRPAQVARELAL